MKTSLLCAAGALVLVGLTACDKNPAVEAARDHSDRLAALPYEERGSAKSSEAPGASGGSGYQSERVSAPRADRAAAPLVHGKPMWSDSRKYSAEENARYQFDHHGTELGAKTLDDFVAKAHDFTDSPPKGAMQVKRANGDNLIYDPKSGLFAVARSDGAPRTLFKPEDGEAYWKAQQKDLGSRSRRPAGGDAG